MRFSIVLALVLAQSMAAQTWTSGEYRYDGAGNIVSIGDRSYGYDAAGRLTKAQIGAAYGYEYDAYGNRTAYVVDQQRVTVPVASATNQLADATYDAAGNQLSRGATAATFDGFGMVTSYRFDAVNAETFVYTASDERIGVLRGDEWTWSIRDPGGRVLRQYRSSSTNPGAPWTWVEDFVHRGSLLLGSERAPADGGRRHSHLDHLGSPRLVTSDAGSTISTHDFLPFGEERMPVGQQLARGFDREHPHRFTGHERDFDVDAPGATSAYVDYMHARYYAAATGRFLSVDPAWESADVATPQSWNRYAYVRNNPVNRIDPDGRMDGNGMGEPLKWIHPGDRRTQLAYSNQIAAGTTKSVLILASLPVPGPEDLAIATVTLALGRRLIARLVGRTAAAGADEVAESLEQTRRGTAGGERAGKPFTPAGKREIHARNAAEHDGTNVCEGCGTDVVPAQKSQKGVTPSVHERQADHIIPRSRGGDGSPSNGQTLCRKCNLDKGDKVPPDQ